MPKFNTLAEQLKPIAQQNAEALTAFRDRVSQHIRTYSDVEYAEQVNKQALRWKDVATAPKR
jgi:hypothetical protein